tara:strand:- start:143 stop:268 length:126 start_codon:yes stop_codon:yes gene_type:complete
MPSNGRIPQIVGMESATENIPPSMSLGLVLSLSKGKGEMVV